jgi:hypothetical protein
MEEPQEQETNRNSDSTFEPGISGNPGGRPVVSFSIVGMNLTTSGVLSA